MRITLIDDKIYIYNDSLSTIEHVINIIHSDDEIILETVNISIAPGLRYGKNFVLTDVIPVRSKTSLRCNIQYLDWFYAEGVKCAIDVWNRLDPKYTIGIDDEDYDEDEEDEDEEGDVRKNIPSNPLFFRGIGSYMDNKDDGSNNWGITPLMSFGTPLVKYNDLYIGVGHLKIHSNSETYPYIPGSNIDNFRQYIYSYMEEQYGDRYITHFGTYMEDDQCQGYMYLIYFYVLTYSYEFTGPLAKIKKWKTMHLSDGYLPLSNKTIRDKDYDRDYKFSLYFPMGLVLDGKTLTVSAGYGDYYSCFLEYNVDDVVTKCRHDVNHLNFNDYQYHLDILQPIM